MSRDGGSAVGEELAPTTFPNSGLPNGPTTDASTATSAAATGAIPNKAYASRLDPGPSDPASLPSAPARTSSIGHGSSDAVQNASTSRSAADAPSREEVSTLDTSTPPTLHPDPNTPSTVALTGATASDPSEAPRRSSMGSLSGKRRRGSAASSRQSMLAHRAPAADVAAPRPEAEAATAGGVEETKRPGFSRFFTILSCCAFPSQANEVDAEGFAVPPKKASRFLVGRRGRQSTPLPKPEAKASVSGGAADEKLDNLRDSENTDLSSTSQPLENAGGLAEPKPGTSGAARECRGEDGLPLHTPSAHAETVGRSAAGAAPSTDATITGADSAVTPQPHTPRESTHATSSRPTEDIEMRDVTPPNPNARAAAEGSELPPPPAVARATIPPSPASARPQSLITNPMHEKQQWLLPPLQPRFHGKKCLVLDLDETLVHSSFKILHQADFTIPVEIEGQFHNVYVIKRPGVDQFMKRVGELYEVVVFTASVSKYGDPLLDQLDIHHVVHHRLFRESCYNHQGNYVKDLSQIGRDLRQTIIIDNSPTSYIFHPQHAVPISSWFSDAHDNELLDLIPVLEDLAGPRVTDVSLVLDVGT
ncbi:MAG: hypothetical protein M1838_001603 [Thelocarpon superellum]|nr:MAG: hypothetical protein M1838_001603 [Thelocarpon superellum]